MKMIGFLTGKEEPFTSDMIRRIKAIGNGEVVADLCPVPQLSLDMEIPYSLIIDRISHVMPYYLQYAQKAMMGGTYVINNPFRFYVDKFYGYALAKEIGVPVPRTVLLPPREQRKSMDAEDLKNLVFPLNWQEIVDYIGFPAFFKPADGWGWRDVYKVESFDELMHYYSQSGSTLMLLQEAVHYDHYVRCFCLGRKHTLPIKYLTDAPFHEQYVVDHSHLTPRQGQLVHEYACAISDRLDFDMNVCEFAFRDGEPVAIDFTNMVPDTNPESIRWHYYEWVIETLSKVAVEYVQNPPFPGVWPSVVPLYQQKFKTPVNI